MAIVRPTEVAFAFLVSEAKRAAWSAPVERRILATAMVCALQRERARAFTGTGTRIAARNARGDWKRSWTATRLWRASAPVSPLSLSRVCVCLPTLCVHGTHFCQGNGKCKADGTCECDAGFGRLDCSLEPPDLLPLIISGGVFGFIIVTALSVRCRVCVWRAKSRLIFLLGAVCAHQAANGVDRTRAQAQVRRCCC
jgi:hypothetical protein